MSKEIPEILKEEYPFESHFHTVEGGLQMHYVDEGKGPVVLMLHGNPTWSFFYRNVIKQLSKNHRCIAVDHIGCGLSDKPQKYKYVLENHIKNVCSLLDTLDIQSTDLIVHDWGGAIGFGVATRRPEIFRRFVVMNTAAFLSKEIPFRIHVCKIPFFGTAAIRGFNAFAGAATTMAVSKTKMSAIVKKGFLLPYNNWKNRIATLKFVHDIPLRKGHHSHEILKAIDEQVHLLRGKPMLICWGGKDFCFNDTFYNEWTKRFPNADTEYSKEAGHYLLEDEGERFIARIEAFHVGS